MRNAYYLKTLNVALTCIEFRFHAMETLFYALQLLTLGDTKYISLDTRKWIM